MYDVIIIGSGAAGLTAALNAKKNSSNIAVISKTYPTHSQTVQAQGGINAVLYEGDDSIEQHVIDTYNASKELADINNIKLMCEKAKDTIHWLDKIGVPFNRDDKDLISQRKFGGTTKIRTCYSSDYTGLKILHTLYDQCIKEDIVFLNEHYLLDLVIENNICQGALFLDIHTTDIKFIKSKVLILATGGYSGIYKNYTTNSYSNTGDGIAAALRAGLKLSNMEFVQFHPTTLVKSNILISESARGEGGYLVDSNEKRFINELSARDEVARAIYTKNKEGNQVHLDLRHLGKEKIIRLMPQERRLAYEFSNIELENELLPINPSAHYTMGGIKTDINAKTNIENIFACGECAQANIHGANRLGGNSLLEIVTFGKIAGINAGKKSLTMNLNDTKTNIEDTYKDKINCIFNKENKINFYDKKNKLGSLMFENVGLFRDETTLNKAHKELELISSEVSLMGINDKSRTYNKTLIEYLEFINMIEISKIITKSALNRKESRGSHFRTDFQNTKDEYKQNSYVIKDNDKIKIEFEDIL